MPHRDHPLRLLVLDDIDQVPRELGPDVRLWLCGLVRLAVREHVRGDDPITPGCEVRDLETPVVRGRREAVDKEERGFARLGWGMEVCLLGPAGGFGGFGGRRGGHDELEARSMVDRMKSTVG